MINLVLCIGLIVLIKGRDQDKTSCDYTAHRRIDAGADGLNGPADEIKYTQYLQLYIKVSFGLMTLTVIYNHYYIQLSLKLRWMIYCYAILALITNLLYVQDNTRITFIPILSPVLLFL